ncbi:MAG: DUF4302 domain-containing protein [Bacteroidaceae bacterium]|nr:DUF4302 domain-containing protein [Bacteroidaceae bacterium]
MNYKHLWLAALLCTSCLKEQEDFFPQPSPLRLQESIEQTMQVLQAAPYGWAMDYYPDRDLSYGGYAYTLRFDSLRVEVRTELSSPLESRSSHYAVTTDAGAVLTFDTYNEFMHFFSTPSSGEYEAKDGDFEFVIDSVAWDFVRLHGKRTHNTITLHRLQEDARTYLEKVIRMGENFAPRATGQIEGQQVEMAIDLNTRHLSYTLDGRAQDSYFVYTDHGVRLLTPMVAGGQRVRELHCDAEGRLTTPLTPAVSLQSEPHDSLFVPFSDYAGIYRFVFYDEQMSPTVRLTPDKFRGGFLLEGINSNYRLFLGYDKNTGSLSLAPQLLGTFRSADDGLRYGVYLMAWDTSSGLLSLNDDCGMRTVWNGDPATPVFRWQSNGHPRFTTDSYYLSVLYNDSDGSLVQKAPPSAWLVGGSMRYIPRLNYLVKTQ